MSVESPTLHLGLAGFTSEQQDRLGAALQERSSGFWQVGNFAAGDAWWINGARVQVLPDTTIRVASGVPGARSMHLDLQDVDRPVAFALPLAPRRFEPLHTFDPASESSTNAVLKTFESWLQPMIAQFCLGANIFEQESVLRSGCHHVTVNGMLIAVVNMHGDSGVVPMATAADFENAMWQRLAEPRGAVPEQFVRTDLSQLMWHYAMRTSRDILPKRYYTDRLYFRRPPRLPQRFLTDAHLLLLRELACAPANFRTLQQSTGLAERALARDLAALYFVGAITSNAKRAAARGAARSVPDSESGGNVNSVAAPGPDSVPPLIRLRSGVARSDLTAPAPVGPR